MGDSSPAIYNMMVAGKWIGTDGDYARSLTASKTYQEAKTAADVRLKDLLSRL
jgi:hypothetical protein